MKKKLIKRGKKRKIEACVTNLLCLESALFLHNEVWHQPFSVFFLFSPLKHSFKPSAFGNPNPVF